MILSEWQKEDHVSTNFNSSRQRSHVRYNLLGVHHSNEYTQDFSPIANNYSYLVLSYAP